jgi:TolB-like protein
MKKLICCFCLLFTLVTVGVFTQQMNLEEVIKNAARDLEEALPQGTMIAVLNFASSSPAFSEYVIEELTGELVTGRKLTIVDRSSLSLIREELNLQLSGDVSDESAQAIGKMLGAQSIVSGNLTNMGTFQRFRVRVISVETAAILTQVSFNLQNDAQVTFLLGENTASFDSSSQQGLPGINQSDSAQDEDAWKSKWIYLGGGLGGGSATSPEIIINSIPYGHKTSPFFAIGFIADFVPLSFFSVELDLFLSFADENLGIGGFFPLIPIMAKVGGKFGLIEITGNLGYTVAMGFTLGGTFGLKAGPGILFAEFLIIPWASPIWGYLDSGMLGTVGYKVGVGKNRR